MKLTQVFTVIKSSAEIFYGGLFREWEHYIGIH